MKFLIAALVLICGSVSAQTYQAGDLTLTDAFSYPTTGRSGAGYFTLTNDGAADALLDVEADYPKVMLVSRRFRCRTRPSYCYRS